jgi:carbonic anhydrase
MREQRVEAIGLRPVVTAEDILPEYRGTPIEKLLRYHNLGEPAPRSHGKPSMLVSMCMDHRKELRVPNEFAYVLRSAGGNLRDSEFELSYAVAVGGVSTVALLAHTDCGMAHVSAKRTQFVDGLIARAGWSREDAEHHFTDAVHRYEIGDPAQFAVGETRRLRKRYPALLFAPFLYTVDDDHLAQIIMPTVDQESAVGP